MERRCKRTPFLQSVLKSPEKVICGNDDSSTSQQGFCNTLVTSKIVAGITLCALCLRRGESESDIERSKGSLKLTLFFFFAGFGAEPFFFSGERSDLSFLFVFLSLLCDFPSFFEVSVDFPADDFG